MKLNLKSQARENGTWLYLSYATGVVTPVDKPTYDDTPAEQKFAFKLLPVGARYAQRMDHLRKPFAKQLRKGIIEVSRERELSHQAMAEVLVIDVDNLFDGDRAIKADDVDDLRQIFRAYPDIAEELFEFASTGLNFEDAAVEAVAGKSARGSSSRSNSVSTQSD